MTSHHGTSGPELLDGQLLIDGQPFEITDLQFVRKIDAGANAVVFSAVDTQLDRPVAVKIWNSHGASRSKDETAKIARISHPLFVTIHRFGTVRNQPFAIMELVKGASVKEWLKSNPPIAERVLVWQLFSRAMRHLYMRGMIHGDPHTGNILIFENGQYPHQGVRPSDGARLAIKVADMGTSVFWSSPHDFEMRERRVLLETATRLFHDQKMDHVLDLSPTLSRYVLLKVIDSFCEYVDTMVPGNEERGIYATRIAGLIVDAPFYRIASMANEVERTKYLGSRLIRRLNAALNGIRDLMDANHECIAPETEARYFALRDAFIEKCRQEFEGFAR